MYIGSAGPGPGGRTDGGGRRTDGRTEGGRNPGLPKGVYSAERKEGSPNTLGFPPNTLGYFRKKMFFFIVFCGCSPNTLEFSPNTLAFWGASPNALECKGVYSGAEYTRISPDTL